MERSKWVEDVLNLPIRKRVQKLKYRKPKALYKRETEKALRQKREKRFLSASQIIDICNENQIGTLKALQEYNRTHDKIITKSNIEHWFGRFSVLKKRLDLSPNKKFDQRQIIDLCVRFNIFRMDDFNYAHQKQPNLFPAISWVISHFGQWRYFKRLLQACSAQFVLGKYIKKKIQLGRYLSRAQCRKYDIDIDFLLKIWTPQQFRQTIELLQDVYKK